MNIYFLGVPENIYKQTCWFKNLNNFANVSGIGIIKETVN